MCALSYCGARDLLCEIRLDYFNSMCTRAAKCLVNTGLVVSLPLADASSTKILLKQDCVDSLADLSQCCSQ